jgi:hypothetical protein
MAPELRCGSGYFALMPGRDSAQFTGQENPGNNRLYSRPFSTRQAGRRRNLR